MLKEKSNPPVRRMETGGVGVIASCTDQQHVGRETLLVKLGCFVDTVTTSTAQRDNEVGFLGLLRRRFEEVADLEERNSTDRNAQHKNTHSPKDKAALHRK